ncbi:MAG: branched-chain amino acid ABC transporter permease [Halobacteriales archaeon]
MTRRPRTDGGDTPERAGDDESGSATTDAHSGAEPERAVTRPAPLNAMLAASGLGGRARAYAASLTDWERNVAGALLAYVALLTVLVGVGVLRWAYLLYLLSLAGMYVLLAMGLNVQWGYSGLINFSVAAFFGVGAYATLLLSSPSSPLLGAEMAIWRWPIVGVVVSILAGVALAVLIGYPTLSLRDDYLAIATLGLAEVVRLFALNQRDWTGGSQGIIGLDRLFGNWPLVGDLVGELSEPELNFLLAVTFVAVTWLLLRRVHRSPWGRVQRLLRADEDLAEALGKNTFRFRMESFVIGGAIMALAGVFFAHFNNSVFPSNLDPIRTFDVWIAAILGGTGSDNGAVVGGIVVVTIIEGTRFTGGVIPVEPGALRLLLTGLLIVALMRFRPEGVLPPQRELVWPAAAGGSDDE